jgi:hypothetical protein
VVPEGAGHRIQLGQKAGPRNPPLRVGGAKTEPPRLHIRVVGHGLARRLNQSFGKCLRNGARTGDNSGSDQRKRQFHGDSESFVVQNRNVTFTLKLAQFFFTK